MFTCKECADRISDEEKCARKVCAVVDAKKVQAEGILCNKEAYDKFLKSIELTLKKIPDVSNLPTDIFLLVSMVRSYVDGTYKEISYNSIVLVVATLLYVVSPIDVIPDMIPGVGFMDDAMAVSICKKTIQNDLITFSRKK